MKRLVRWCWVVIFLVAVACGPGQEVLADTKRLEDFRVWDWKIVGASVEKVETSRNSPLGREGTILVGRGVWNLPPDTDQVEVVRELERQGLGLTYVSCGRALGFGANLVGFETSLYVSGHYEGDQLVVVVNLPPRSQRGAIGANVPDLVDGPGECESGLAVGPS